MSSLALVLNTGNTTIPKGATIEVTIMSKGIPNQVVKSQLAHDVPPHMSTNVEIPPGAKCDARVL
jgi:hypothetical protein